MSSSFGTGGFRTAAAVGGATAGAAGAASLGFGPIAAGLALFRGATSFFGTRARNEAIAESAEETARRINTSITESRVQGILQTADLARQLDSAIGSAVVSVDPGNVSARNRIAANLSGAAGADQFAIQEETRRRVRALEAERANVVARAESQIVNPLLAAVGGASAGFQQGVNIEQAGRQLDLVQQRLSFLDELAEIQLQSQRSQAAFGRRMGALELDNLRLQNQALRRQGAASQSRLNAGLSDLMRLSTSPFVTGDFR